MSLLSVSVKTSGPKWPWGDHGLFRLCIDSNHSRSLKDVRTGTEAGIMVGSCFLASLHGLLSLFSYTTQNHLHHITWTCLHANRQIRLVAAPGFRFSFPECL